MRMGAPGACRPTSQLLALGLDRKVQRRTKLGTGRVGRGDRDARIAGCGTTKGPEHFRVQRSRFFKVYKIK